MKSSLYYTLAMVAGCSFMACLGLCCFTSLFCEEIMRSPHLRLLLFHWEMPSLWVMLLVSGFLLWAFHRAFEDSVQKEERMRRLGKRQVIWRA